MKFINDNYLHVKEDLKDDDYYSSYSGGHSHSNSRIRVLESEIAKTQYEIKVLKSRLKKIEHDEKTTSKEVLF